MREQDMMPVWCELRGSVVEDATLDVATAASRLGEVCLPVADKPRAGGFAPVARHHRVPHDRSSRQAATERLA